MGDVVQETQGIEQSLPVLPVPDRLVRQGSTTLPERPKSRHQITVVYRGDVTRSERLKTSRVVPVNEVAFIGLELIHAFQSLPQTCGQIQETYVAQIIGCKSGKEQ